jgi:hypothetical protein
MSYLLIYNAKYFGQTLEILAIVRWRTGDCLDCVGKVPVSGVSRDARWFATSEMLTKNIRRWLLPMCL